MNDPDNFLSRWSRRKQEAGERNEKKKEAAGKPPVEPVAESEPGKVASVPETTPEPKFDVESLPPIESISAQTDITAFMRTGVPEALKRAALRRAWSSDPAIRDFVGLNENFWDRAGPVPGFGDLDPDLDVQRMVSDLLGEGRDKVQADLRPGTGEPGTGENVASSQVEDAPGESQLPPTIASASPVAEDEIPQPSENAATQKEVAESPSAKKVARRHGGAIPQ